MLLKCPKGKIVRRSYNKKGYVRKSFSRHSKKTKRSSKVKGTYVSRTRVPATCVPAKGAYAKQHGTRRPASKRTLPKPGKELELGKYGYNTHETDAKRHIALDKASKAENPLAILRRVNLLRNYQTKGHAKDTMAKDVKYLSKRYKEWKKKNE